ncbi:MAG: PAS domain-containing protein [Flavobacterium sp.]|nr:PAS domain-containing protein [Flavobacterium sp.]
MAVSVYEEVKKVYGSIAICGSIADQDLQVEMQRKLLEFFHVGKFYYYLFDVMNSKFEFISPQITDVLGYSPDIDAETFFSKLHPDDQSVMLNYEKAVVDFFSALPAEKLPKYKFTYDYRVMNSSGEYVRLLQQVTTVRFNAAENVLTTFGVHTDITSLKQSCKTSLSFIGLDGEPSYIDYQAEQTYKPSKQIFTKREKEILRLLLCGAHTLEIARELCISVHTVNTHRKNVLAKTGTKTTAELAAKAINEGLL